MSRGILRLGKRHGSIYDIQRANITVVNWLYIGNMNMETDAPTAVQQELEQGKQLRSNILIK